MAHFIDEYLLEYLSSSRDGIPWNPSTSLIVVNHVINFLPGLDKHDTLLRTIRRLNRLAEEWSDIKFDFYRWKYEKQKMEAKKVYKEQEMERIFINSFMPEVRRFFNIPKLQQLSDADKSLKQNEVLAGFIVFLLHILDSEGIFWFGYRKHWYAILQKNLTCLFTILGDTPFWCTELKDVSNNFMELKSLAKKAGNFIYSCVFTHTEMRYKTFDAGIQALLEKIHTFLNVKFKNHNFKVVEFPKAAISRISPLHSPFIVDSLLEDLEGLMNGRFGLAINDIEDQLKMLIDELTFIQTVLKNIQPPQVMHTNELKEFLIEIREVAYEAEYLIKTHVMGRLPPWYLNLRLPGIVQKLKLCGRKLQEEIQKSSEVKYGKITDGYNRVVSSQVVKNPEDVVESFVMGFEDNRTKILADLTLNPGELKVISIFGMPGIGKSTIARKLYNDRAVYNHFDLRAWCVVSQTYNKKKVLYDILMSLGSKSGKDNVLQMGEESVGLEIHQSLYRRRYLIIMDDVWCSRLWDDLRRYFPDDGNGSRILLTSRIKDIAPTDSIFHAPPLLSESQCEDLLLKKVFKNEPCPPELFGIAKKIASKCHGLPLAIVVVAGIVANSGKDESLWRNVEANLDSYMSGDQSNYMKILELSYEHLPDHLKPCFLYMGAFREDEEVPVRKVIKLWIAEGFVHEKEEKSLEHVAEGYFFELVNRSLLMISKRRSDGGIKTCSIHDLLHDMCQRKAGEEKFLKHIRKSSIYEQHSHLVSYSTPKAAFAALHCHSLTGFLPSVVYHVSQMPLLRVINEVQVESSSPPCEIERLCTLVYLKYLCLKFSTPEFPIGLCKLVDLEYLYFTAYDTIHVPPTIVKKMVKLRHVCISYQVVFDKSWDDSRTTNNLRSLSHVLIRSEDESEILKCSPHLRELKCVSDGSLFPNLNFLTELGSLSMKFTSPPKGVELTVGYFPSTIKKLSLYRSSLPWDKMSIVGSLPNLHVLKLICCAFVGEEWEMSDYEFVKLKFLKLSDVSLKHWDTSNENFPELECLVLEYVRGPVNIPSEFCDIPTLERIEVRHCRYEMETSAFQIEEERQRNGNDDLKVIITSDKRPKNELEQEKRDNEEPLIEDEDNISETGVVPEDIERVMYNAWVSRGRAVKALKDADGDIVAAIMDYL